MKRNSDTVVRALRRGRAVTQFEFRSLLAGLMGEWLEFYWLHVVMDEAASRRIAEWVEHYRNAPVMIRLRHPWKWSQLKVLILEIDAERRLLDYFTCQTRDERREPFLGQACESRRRKEPFGEGPVSYATTVRKLENDQMVSWYDILDCLIAWGVAWQGRAKDSAVQWLLNSGVLRRVTNPSLDWRYYLADGATVEDVRETVQAYDAARRLLAQKRSDRE